MAKRLRAVDNGAMHQSIKEAMLEAMEEDFPWTGALGDPLKTCIITLARAANAPPEFALLGL